MPGIDRKVEGRRNRPWLWLAAGCCIALTFSLALYPRAQLPLLLMTFAIAYCYIAIESVWLARVGKSLGIQGTYPLGRAVHGQVLKLIEANRSIAQRLVQRHGVSGLPTRERLIQAMKEGPGVLGLIEFADFDRLSAIDPEKADQVLAEIAQRITRMAGTTRIAAHVDRAHFALWFADATESEASPALQAITYALQDRILIGDEELLPVIRMGHLQCDPQVTPPEKLLSRAFSLLAAHHGSLAGRVEALSQAIHCDFALEQDLRRAITGGEFELWFQPFLDARSRSICGAEALIRWRHPVRGLISPAEFIPLAEEAGLAGEIGTWVLDGACRAARNWSATALPGVKVAVNVSGHQLKRDGFDLLAERTLSRHGLPPRLLELELTETIAMADSRTAALLFERVRALGVSISIDDFGTGYSSLSYLKKLSFDKLKIDREFVADVDSRKDSQAICQSIIALGRGLGISVLAEGVERQEEMIWLRRHGCQIFQGFYFARPMPEADFLAFARDGQTIASLFTPKSLPFSGSAAPHARIAG
jgi:EAL domain-containing protein (putative c-di-GMP-specific phosphodiesterase class I)/GGDEF domain-containing protein